MLAMSPVGETAAFLAALRERGMLAAGGAAVRFFPPLNITEDDLEAGLKIIEATLSDLR